MKPAGAQDSAELHEPATVVEVSDEQGRKADLVEKLGEVGCGRVVHRITAGQGARS